MPTYKVSVAKMLNFNVLLLIFVSSVTCEDVLKQPNIVMFLTDDQDIVLNGMNPMKNVHRFIQNEGVRFTNAFVSSPICCPSRASILTGLYPHNHHTLNNSINGGCYNDRWRRHELKTFATVLQSDGGYNTFYAGKYLNQYGVKQAGGPEIVPPGWSQWHGLVGNSVYYDYTISNNGVPTKSSDLYLTDIIRDLSIAYIENQTETHPFLMVIAPPAPHAPFTPAKRHEGIYNNETMTRQPNFNTQPKDKHWLMRMPPSPLPESILPELEQVYRARWETLLAVDEMVADVIDALDTHSLLDNTYLIYTSDNGYHIGQFSQVYDKRQPYETDIRVPLLIKGPGITNATVIEDPVMSIDLAPTIITLAGLTPPDSMDGVPMNLFNEKKDSMRERNMLIEYYGEHSSSTVDASCPWKYDENLSECLEAYDCKCQDAKNNTYACIRHLATNINYKYCYFDDTEQFTEVYDLATDPYELENIVDRTLPAIKQWYMMTLRRLLMCKGRNTCHGFPQESIA